MLIYLVSLYIYFMAYFNLIQGSNADYNKLEEMLRKSSPSDLESGITLASEAIEEHEMDAKLYLLRGKLSFKLVRLRSLKCRYSYFVPYSLLSNSFVEE